MRKLFFQTQQRKYAISMLLQWIGNHFGSEIDKILITWMVVLSASAAAD